jgi:hypothetical protein
MRLRPRIGIDINLVDDYGDIYVGPLEISWCNQAYMSLDPLVWIGEISGICI